VVGRAGAAWRAVQRGDRIRFGEAEVVAWNPEPPGWERQRVRNDDSVVVEVRLGDVSLFVAGFLSYGFARRLVDIDYHIAMGGRAYGTLADTCVHGPRGRALSGVFAELAAKFQRLVDALNDVSEMSWRNSDRDTLRLYEVWLKTGSPRAHALLRDKGVGPAVVPVGRKPN